ncbi:pentapeptide repeat-containing protein [Streptomyces sp. NPDC050121]|uniref:pentapeptide repeat-containing protein n=1 Tax=Streptomyces sp. NPDC050121 TaxID=3365601 RepID=UPI003787A1C3
MTCFSRTAAAISTAVRPAQLVTGSSLGVRALLASTSRRENCARPGAPRRGATVRPADLSHADLSHADLSHADLGHAGPGQAVPGA